MTVLDILKTASVYLNIDDTLAPVFNDGNVTSEAQAVFDRLLISFNEMVGYLFASHFDAIDSSEVTFDQDGKYDLSNLTKNIKVVKSVKCAGKNVAFKQVGNFLISRKDMTATITYAYLPEEFDEDDDFDFVLPIDLGTLAIGVAWFYSLNNAIYDDAENFKEQFLENVGKMSRPSVRRISQRRWE